MGPHHDLVQRAVVLGIAMICTLLNGAFNALICIVVHSFSLLLLISPLVFPANRKILSEIFKKAELPISGSSKDKEERK